MGEIIEGSVVRDTELTTYYSISYHKPRCRQTLLKKPNSLIKKKPINFVLSSSLFQCFPIPRLNSACI